MVVWPVHWHCSFKRCLKEIFRIKCPGFGRGLLLRLDLPQRTFIHQDSTFIQPLEWWETSKNWQRWAGKLLLKEIELLCTLHLFLIDGFVFAKEIETVVGEELCRLFPIDENVDIVTILRHMKRTKARSAVRLPRADPRNALHPRDLPLGGPVGSHRPIPYTHHSRRPDRSSSRRSPHHESLRLGLSHWNPKEPLRWKMSKN